MKCLLPKVLMNNWLLCCLRSHTNLCFALCCHGDSYTIVRVCGFNEIPSGEASTIDLKQSNDEMTAVSRAEVAQVCAEALLDPNALNKSFYMGTAKRKSQDLTREEDLSSKFAVVPPDASR